MIELREDSGQPQKLRNVLIETKIDGSRHTWDGSHIVSDRGIIRDDRFSHIVAELKQMAWRVRGEVAVPFGHVLELNAKENWPSARFYVFDMFEWDGDDAKQADAAENRRLIEAAFAAAPRFQHLRYPFKFATFEKGWAFVLKHRLEGLVLKEVSGQGRQFKTKRYIEVKVPIVGLEQGAVKGAFLVLVNGVTCKVSAASEGNVAKYKAILKSGQEPYAEIEYLFLTKNGIMFQPRLRDLGTRKQIVSKAS
jgi:ATP-dependent DNA ligase